MRQLGEPSEIDDDPAPESRTESLELDWPLASGPWMLEIGSPSGNLTRPLEAGQRVVIGSGRAADIRIADRAISAEHARLHATDKGVHVEDLASKNGVFVGHARVDRVLLPGGPSSFVVGRTTITVRPLSPEDEIGDVETLPGVIGTSAVMRRVAREVRRHAAHRVAVLLHGESGTGKDVVARAIHTLSRRPGPLMPVNVGAISESLADAELFGHRRGAFTGAVGTRAGAFEQAHRGTLFLDEIAELSPSLQVKLLRVVEDGVVRPIGATQPMQVDVRLVAATWIDLAEKVGLGQFREDLYHRLARVVIELPPLRQRRSDIPALSSALLARMEPEIGTKRLSSAALARLVAHAWPGNVRELDSVLYRAAVAAEAITIAPHHIEVSMPRSWRTSSRALKPIEVLALLDSHRGNITAASRAAGVARSTFRAWVERARKRS